MNIKEAHQLHHEAQIVAKNITLETINEELKTAEWILSKEVNNAV